MTRQSVCGTQTSYVLSILRKDNVCIPTTFCVINKEETNSSNPRGLPFVKFLLSTLLPLDPATRASRHPLGASGCRQPAAGWILNPLAQTLFLAAGLVVCNGTKGPLFGSNYRTATRLYGWQDQKLEGACT